ncbi:MAG: DUF3078 domain-containing protein [Bacteroidetes bacterium]|nr:DUF3078 domain-containing protein [Bacteroidota bacterium]HET6243600.1 DUF3078 domain-containing protein [Bacteroidia bacterium]
MNIQLSLLKNTVLVLILLLPFKLLAQENDQVPAADTIPIWRFSGIFNANFSQVHLSNWVGGGENSQSAAGLLQLRSNYLKEKAQWDNSLEVGYGFLQSQTKGFLKTDDKIDFVSNYSYKAYKDFNYSALLSFNTQFTPGYSDAEKKILISDFLAPAYLITSLGLNYKRGDLITIMLSPLTGKFTIVNQPDLSAAGAFGVTPGEIVREEFGSYFKAMFRKENIINNVSLQVKLDLFSNYLEKPENIDVNWETMVILKVNKYINANISSHLIYDHDIEIGVDTNGDGLIDSSGPRTQFKEVLSIGLTFKF